MKTTDVSLLTKPLYSLDLQTIEPIFKTWIAEVLSGLKHEPTVPVYYSRYEICKLLKISLPTLGRYVDLGIIVGHKVGNRILFSQKDIDAALLEIVSC